MTGLVIMLTGLFLASGAGLAYVVGAASVMSFIATDNIRHLAILPQRIFSQLDKFCRTTSVGFLALMLLLVLLQVVARYIFQAAPVWTEEGARYCMVWSGLFGATVAFRANRDPRLFHPPKTGPRIRKEKIKSCKNRNTLLKPGWELSIKGDFINHHHGKKRR